ncbi:hypothetical protein VMCG_03674 [Cytospora schulzeri]|uniref:CorA-like transporter domain-containing protein n=1 Tax=Cytospora schulzeri TaxID=448051 RepID=A0A423WW45_9PEZI|nr:hypothetical protein VMCG_03674 [Valsa malicola]
MASYLPLPDRFQQSYLEKDSYPRNLIDRTIGTYPSALNGYADRLTSAAPNLCYVPDADEADVSFYDIQADNGAVAGVEKRNIHSQETLTEWLTVKNDRDGNSPQSPEVLVTKKDPKCRLIYIYSQNALARLRITLSMLVEILSFHQVMPDYLDFLLVFGLQSYHKDLGFCSFREHTSLKPSMETKMTVLGPVGKGHHHRLYTPGDVQDLLQWGEKVTEAITALEYNVDIMDSLRNFYTGLSRNQDCGPAMTCSDDVEVFANYIGNIIHDFKLQIFRSKALAKLLTDRTELVKQLRIERLNYHMESEAIVVRIITIVTLVYLPATFTSTFFSTDIITYQGQDSPGGNFSRVAMNRWLQVTIPLSFLTLVVAYWGKKWAERKSRLGDSAEGQGDTELQVTHNKSWFSSFTVPQSSSFGLRKRLNRTIPLLPLRNPAGL